MPTREAMEKARELLVDLFDYRGTGQTQENDAHTRPGQGGKMSEPSEWAEDRARERLPDAPMRDRLALAYALDEARREGCRIGLEAAARQADHVYECANSSMKELTGHPEDERYARMLEYERGTAEELAEKARTADPAAILAAILAAHDGSTEDDNA